MMEIGNKAEGLRHLKQLGIRTPKYQVLGKDFFGSVLKDAGIYNQIQLVLVKSGDIKDIFSDMRRTLDMYQMPEQLKALIDSKMYDISEPLAVRSSSVEDGKESSCAGLFHTRLNVKKEEVYNEIINVIASLYQECCIMAIQNQNFHPDNYYMGVILQEMICSQISGVAFSADPVNNDLSVIMIEMVKGYGEELVSGLSNSTVIEVPKGFEIPENDEIDKDILKELVEIVYKLENYFGYPVDVEWAVENNVLYILQCRPITTLYKEKKLDKCRMFNMAQMDEDVYEILAGLKSRYQKWRKKAKFLKVCEDNDILAYKWKFLSFSRTCINDIDFDLFLKDFESEYIYYYTNSLFVAPCRVCDFKDIVYKIADSYESSIYCISVRECLPNELSAISQCCADGNVHIECVSGKMVILNNGIAVPTTYIVDKYNDIVFQNVTKQNIYVFDYDVMNIRESEEVRGVKLSEEMIKYIADKTRTFQMKFHNCSPEWWIWNDKVYAADMSLLKTELNSKEGKIISQGLATGYLRKFPDLSEDVVRNIAMFSAISVSDAEFDVDKVNVLKEIEEVFIKWRNEGDIILYCKQSYIFLTPFRKYVNGFVFENASTLCHLSLIIREDGIPAIALVGKDVSQLIDKQVKLDAIEGNIVEI